MLYSFSVPSQLMLTNTFVLNFYQLPRLFFSKFTDNVHTKDPSSSSQFTLSVKKRTGSSVVKQPRYISGAQKSAQTQWAIAQIKMILA